MRTDTHACTHACTHTHTTHGGLLSKMLCSTSSEGWSFHSRGGRHCDQGGHPTPATSMCVCVCVHVCVIGHGACLDTPLHLRGPPPPPTLTCGLVRRRRSGSRTLCSSSNIALAEGGEWEEGTQHHTERFHWHVTATTVLPTINPSTIHTRDVCVFVHACVCPTST